MNRIALLVLTIFAISLVALSGEAGAEEKLEVKSFKGELSLPAEKPKIDYLLRPGSGWVVGSIPQFVIGIPSVLIGIAMAGSSSGCSCEGVKEVCTCGIGKGLGLITLGAGAVLIASGGVMAGYGVAQNRRFSEEKMGYVSPATGYVVGGAVNTIVGVTFITMGACYPKAELGVASMVVGSGIAAYGLGFLIYGATKDFHKEADKFTDIKKAIGSLTPYFKCSGGSCDGNTIKTTGREIYIGGLQGVF